MLRYFGFSVGLTVAALVTAIVFGGPAALLAVAVLGVLEVCLSFDNAVVNAKVLRRMSPLWRKLFLYVGIFIAVFGMRLLLPIVLVSVTAGLSIPEVWDLALSDQEAYATNVESAAEAIYTFGGIFLLMIFLTFLTDEERDIHWLAWFERPLAKAGVLPYLSVVIALATIYVGSQIADDDKYANWPRDNMAEMAHLATGIQLADENLGQRPAKFATDEAMARLDNARAAYDPDGRFYPWMGRV